MRFKADLLLLLVTVIWGSAFAVMRFAAGRGTLFYLNGSRFLLGALVVLPFTRFSKLTGSFTRRNWLYPTLAGFALFTAVGFQQAGLAHTTAGNGGFITSLYTVIIPLVLWLIWKERPSWVVVAAILLAVVGAFLLSTAGQFIFQKGDLLILAGSFFWAMHVIVVGRVQGKMEALAFALGQFAVCGVLNLLVAPFVEHPDMGTMILLLPAILYTGIFSVALAFTLQVVAQKHTPANDAALIMSLEAVFAVIFGWMFLGENLLPIQIAGCGLILLAVILVQIRSFGSVLAKGRADSAMVQ